MARYKSTKHTEPIGSDIERVVVPAARNSESLPDGVGYIEPEEGLPEPQLKPEEIPTATGKDTVNDRCYVVPKRQAAPERPDIPAYATEAYEKRIEAAVADLSATPHTQLNPDGNLESRVDKVLGGDTHGENVWFVEKVESSIP